MDSEPKRRSRCKYKLLDKISNAMIPIWKGEAEVFTV